MEHESAASLLSRLVGDCTALVRNEIALAKAELAESTTRAKAGVAALIGAVATLLAGSLALIAAIILGLAEVMEPWLAALIVGVAISCRRLLPVAGRTQEVVAAAPGDRSHTRRRPQRRTSPSEENLMNATSERPGSTAIPSSWSALRTASAPTWIARSMRSSASCRRVSCSTARSTTFAITAATWPLPSAIRSGAIRSRYW